MQQFSFQIDREVQKIVTIEKFGRSVDVRVQFATDGVIEERVDRLLADGDIAVRSDEHGVSLSYVPSGQAIRITRTRRY